MTEPLTDQQPTASASQTDPDWPLLDVDALRELITSTCATTTPDDASTEDVHHTEMGIYQQFLEVLAKDSAHTSVELQRWRSWAKQLQAQLREIQSTIERMERDWVPRTRSDYGTLLDLERVLFAIQSGKLFADYPGLDQDTMIKFRELIDFLTCELDQKKISLDTLVKDVQE